MTTHPWIIRLAHWANVVLLAVMAASGMRILAAFPSFGPRGEPARWYPFHGTPPPDALTLGEWLAGARHYHFAFAWLFVFNGVAYVFYLFASGEYRERLFSPRRDAPHVLAMIAYYLRLRREPPRTGLYNPLQRAAYTSALLFAFVSIVTGLVMYAPVQFPRLNWLLGGYDNARALHLFALVAVSLFTIAHVVMVVLHVRTLRAMTIGGRNG